VYRVFSSKGVTVRILLAAGMLCGSAVLLTVPQANAQNLSTTQRVVQGKVYAASGAAQAGAVVYLKNEKSLEIKTYISTQDGMYRFGQLGTGEDYQLWAEFGGHKSKTRTISAFDAKKIIDVALHIEDK
jgi:uncharacterized surface anchored protein